MDLGAGTIISERYVIESQIGEGGMAVVYRAQHTTLGTLHAVKVLTMTGRSIRERMIQEGRLQAKLRHPNIVAVTDVVDVNGAPALVMELVEGPSLDELVKAQRLTLDQADAIGRGVLAGVAHAHAQGLIHRDLKPANVMLQVVEGGVVPKVTDFGLAKVLVGDETARAATRTGATMGTPQYMSPEQIKDAKNVDARSDVFACGAILYELVTGNRAFDGENLLEIFGRVARAEYPDPRGIRPEAPERMFAAIEGALQVDPSQRTPSVSALFAAWSGGEPLAATSMVAFSLPGPVTPAPAPRRAVSSSETLAFDPSPSASPRSLAPTLMVGGGLVAVVVSSLVVGLVVLVAMLLWTRPSGPVIVERTVFLPDGRQVVEQVVVEPEPAGADAVEPPPVPGVPRVPTPGPTPASGVADPSVGEVPEPALDTDIVPWNELPEEVRDAAVVVVPDPVPVVPDPVPPPPPAGQAMTLADLPQSLRATGSELRKGAVWKYASDADPLSGRYLAVLVDQDPDTGVQRAALDALMQRWDRGLPPVTVCESYAVSAIGGSDAESRNRALVSYARKGSSLAPLQAPLDHRDAGVRKLAAEAVGGVGARTDQRAEARRMLAARKMVEEQAGVLKQIDRSLDQMTGG